MLSTCNFLVGIFRENLIFEQRNWQWLLQSNGLGVKLPVFLFKILFILIGHLIVSANVIPGMVDRLQNRAQFLILILKMFCNSAQKFR